jgi:hypothetical protein
VFQKIADKASAFTRGTLRVIGTLIGVKWKGEWTAEGLCIAGWIFMLGIPAGMLILGASFSLELWLMIILMILIITNLDDALLQMHNYLTYGVDGEVVGDYEKVD